MKRFILLFVMLAVSTAGMLLFSQSRTVISTDTIGRSVITTDSTSYNGIDIWKQLEQERIAAEKTERERIETEKRAEQIRIAKEKAERERIEAEKQAEQERIAAEKKAKQERLSVEKQRIIDSIAAIREEKKAFQKARRDSIKIARHERIVSYPWTNMILLNGAYAIYPEYAFGITYARVKQGGFYISAMMNPSIRFSADYYADSWGIIHGEKPFYSGKKSSTRISATFGGLVRLRVPLYLYAGVGYGFRGLFYETNAGEWVAWRTFNTIYHGMHWETGFMGNIRGFGISLGISSITDFSYIYYEGKLGLGYCF